MKVPTRQTIVAIIIFLLSLTTYVVSANPVPSGYADSDEIVTMGHLFSVAHPPGYGLFVVLVGVFQRLFFWVSPAYASNIFAALLGSMTVTILFLTTTIIAKEWRELDSWDLFGIASGAMVIGLSGLFWLHSAIIEVMSLGNLLLACTLYFATKWFFCAKTIKNALLTAFMFGLGIAHLQPLILLGPGLLYLFILGIGKEGIKDKRHIPKTIFLVISITTCAFIVSSALIIPLNMSHQPFSWDFPSTITGWWRMVTRQDYQGFFPDKNIHVENAYLSKINFDFLLSAPIYITTLWNQLAGPPLLVIILGAIYFLKKNKSFAIGYLLFFIFLGFLFGCYVTVVKYTPGSLEYRLFMGIAHRQYVVGFTTLGVFSGFGGLLLVELIRSFIHTNWYKTVLLSMCILLPPLMLGYTNRTIGYQRENSLIYDYNRSLLDSALPNAVIICSDDISCYGLYYQSLVEKIRPDVTVLSKIPGVRHNFFINKPEYIGFEYGDNPLFYAQEISWNVAHRPTYLTSLETFYIDYIGLDSNPFYAIPNGYLFQIVSTFPQKGKDFSDDTIADQYLSKEFDSRNMYYFGLRDYFANNFQSRAYLYIKYRDIKSVMNALKYSNILNNDNKNIETWVRHMDSSENLMAYLQPPQPRPNYLQEALESIELGDLDVAYIAARKASYVYPTSPEPLLLLKNIYTMGGYLGNANLTQAHIEALKTIRD